MSRARHGPPLRSAWRRCADVSQGLGGRYGGRSLGTIADAGCFSFDATESVACGDCGAFVTSHEVLADRARAARAKGTVVSAAPEFALQTYVWMDVGASFVPSDVLAAVALAQLRKTPQIVRRREALWNAYQNGLEDLEASSQIIRRTVAPQTVPNWSLYPFRLLEARRRDEVVQELRRRGIGASAHFSPLHSSPYARERWGYRPEGLPVTSRVAASLVLLPLYPGLCPREQEYIIDSLHDILLG